MKILFIVTMPLELNSSASLRNISTINGLSRQGNEVTVLTSAVIKTHPSYMEIKLDNSIKIIRVNSGISKALSAKVGKIEILSKIKSILYKFWDKANIYDTWTFMINSREINKIHISDFELLISSSDPKSSHLLAEKIKGTNSIPWIQIWGDPFSGDISSSNNNEERRATEEARFFNKAQKIFFLSELTFCEMTKRYPDISEKFRFMPRPYLEKRVFDKRSFNGGKLSLSYCGDYISKVRNIKPFYEAVKKTKDNLTICGRTDINLASDTNIKIKPRVSQEIVNELESQSDVLIHLSNLSGTQIPGKIFDYSATNKPILFILDGNTELLKKQFSKYNRYLFCNNTVEDIVNKLEIIRCGKYPGKLEPVEDFYVGNVMKKLLE